MARRLLGTNSDGQVLDNNPRLLRPARVRAGEIRLARHVLCAFGLISDSVGDVTLDGRVALIQPHPESDLYLCPLTPHPQPSELEAWFYGDCIAYEHDIPVIVCPKPSDLYRFNYRYIHSGPSKPREEHITHLDSGKVETFIRHPASPLKVAKTFYPEQLLEIIGQIRELRHGPLTYVIFRWPGFNNRVDLPYSRKYGPVATQIHLYATALRQADTLSEYLCYYRVIENATASNGVEWVKNAISRIAPHDFGYVAIAHSNDYDAKPKNMMQVYRRRALQRLKRLIQIYGTAEAVADYLYKVNRCGIAHGRNIIKADITSTYFEIVRDTYILKLLARIAIDEGVGFCAP